LDKYKIKSKIESIKLNQKRKYGCKDLLVINHSERIKCSKAYVYTDRSLD